MKFGYTDEQQSLCREIREFAAQELIYDLKQRDADAVFLEENWRACAQRGIFGLCAPPEYGGSGLDMVTTVAMLEALGYGCPDNGLTLAINGQIWAVQEPIMSFGTDQQKERYLTKLIDGSQKGAHGMTEPETGSDAFSLRTTAKPTSDGYLLNGTKTYIGLGPIADVVLTFAATDPTKGRWGISALIVETSTAGVTLRPPQDKMGLRTAPMGEIEFRDALVPRENLLGKEGAGASIFNASMEYERSFIFASHVGSMARQLDETIRYAQTRKLSGQPIGKFQANAHRIADMKTRLETARLLLHQAAWLIDEGQRIPMEAAMAKLVISEALLENSLSAVRVHGGKGYLNESNVGRDLRDVIGGVIYSGTSDIQRNLIAGLLGL